jgi:hypothetical protein
MVLIIPFVGPWFALPVIAVGAFAIALSSPLIATVFPGLAFLGQVGTAIAQFGLL